MIHDSEEELRAQFGGLRAHEQGSAPDFRSLIERDAPVSESRASALVRWRIPALISLAAAAAIVLVAGALKRADTQRVVDARSLSNWSSPTASLLRAPKVDRYHLISLPTTKGKPK